MLFGGVPLAWSIAMTGDFDGDGKSDIMWRHASGTVGMWIMNGSQVVSAVAVGQVSSAAWSIQGLNAE
jgi:hypothetical protein